MSVIIVSAGNFGREIAGWMKMLNAPIKGFIDDEKPGNLGTIKDYQPKLGEELLVCISDPKGRQSVVESLIERKAVFHNFSMCIIAPSAMRGVGCVLCPNSLMSNGSAIGDFTIVNVFSSIGHDVQVGKFCTLSSHVDLTGHVVVGDRVFFGSGARVLPKVKIGNDAVIGAGAIVVNDVPDGATVYAAPARML
jgi:sugar O-acyltransferase (sialic acid O-acetyltransferase NeuD family)